MNSNKSWELHIDEKVYKTFKKFPKQKVKRITQAIRDLPNDPYVGDLRKVQGERNTWRRRIGEYRIFFEVHQIEKRIDVRWVERKASKTYS